MAEILEQLSRAGPSDDDARVPMPGRQDGGTTRVEMERRGVLPPGQRMPDDDDVELATLQAVGGVDDDVRQPPALQLDLQRRPLVSMRDADRQTALSTSTVRPR